MGRDQPDLRGNNKDRKSRKLWLLSEHGDGKTCPCRWCGEMLTYKTLTVDRSPICGHDGGRYTRDNIVPACATCNFGRCNKCVETDANCSRQLRWMEGL